MHKNLLRKIESKLYLDTFKIGDIIQAFSNTFISGNAFRYSIIYIAISMLTEIDKMRK